MPKDKTKSIINLHLVIFIWGFTSILGRLISIDSFSIVWYRMFLASAFIFLYFILLKKNIFNVNMKSLFYFSLGGLLISIHWLLLFHSIKVSSVSIAVSMLSTGAIMMSVIEPLIKKKKILYYQLFLGILVSLGVFIIFFSEKDSFNGIIYGLFAALLSVFFTILNKKLVNNYNPNTITFYEIFSGFIFLTFCSIFFNKFSIDFFNLNLDDFIWLFILSSICTAFAFTYSVKIMKHISPYTFMISINLEPVYAIGLSIIIFKEKELLSLNFYIGVLIIIISVFINGFLKFNQNQK